MKQTFVMFSKIVTDNYKERYYLFSLETYHCFLEDLGFCPKDFLFDHFNGLIF